MKVETVPYGSRLVDSYPFSIGGTAAQARALKASGVDGVIGYLGAMTKSRLNGVLAAGLGFMPVTRANEFNDGADDELAQLRALGIPAGATAWLDMEGRKMVEGKDWAAAAPTERERLVGVLLGKLRAWANEIKAAGYVPGLYVGAPQPLTGRELYSLPFVRYWLGIGRCVDRFGDDAYPDCGWCVRQDWHNDGTGHYWRNTGVFVDTNSVQCDHRGRKPAWVVG